MPIRLECPHCRRAMYFADNDAGLAVSCLTCKAELRVPTPAPRAAAALMLPDEPPPLFANTPGHLLAAPPAAQPTPAAPPHDRHPPRPRRIRPASPRPRWRWYAILIALPAAAALIFMLKHRHEPPAEDQARRDAPTTHPAGATQPTITMTARATPNPTAAHESNGQPTNHESTPAGRPILASIAAAVPATARPTAASYTPAAAPMGFIGLQRIDLSGRVLIDSYNSDAGPYSSQAARSDAIVLSNGPIVLNASGRIRAAVHAGRPDGGKPRKNLAITGSTEPLAAPLNVPGVELDPFAHDSANRALPGEFFKGGNFFLHGRRSLSLPGGVYYVNDFTVDDGSTLRLDGPVTILASGQVCIYGRVETSESRPDRLRIRSTGDKPVNIARNNTLFLDLYAPQSAVRISGNGNVFGSIVGRSLRISGARNLHFDEAMRRSGR